jgi:hypothetical protein
MIGSMPSRKLALPKITLSLRVLLVDHVQHYRLPREKVHQVAEVKVLEIEAREVKGILCPRPIINDVNYIIIT